MNNLLKSILFFGAAYWLLWLDWLAYATGDLKGACVYLLKNGWPTLVAYAEYRMTSAWPVPALLSFGCLAYSWHLLRIWSIDRQYKEKVDAESGTTTG